MSKSKDSEDVLSLLDSLGDSAVPPPSSTDISADPTSTGSEKELLGFLDDLAKQPARSTTPRPARTRSSGDSARNVNVTKKTPERVTEKPAVAASVPPQVIEGEKTIPKSDSAGWLGGLWSMGSAAIKSAEQRVKELQQTEEAKALEERVRGNVSVLGKLGIPTFHTGD
jgi:hypothetical protein